MLNAQSYLCFLDRLEGSQLIGKVFPISDTIKSRVRQRPTRNQIFEGVHSLMQSCWCTQTVVYNVLRCVMLFSRSSVFLWRF